MIKQWWLKKWSMRMFHGHSEKQVLWPNMLSIMLGARSGPVAALLVLRWSWSVRVARLRNARGR